MFSLFLIQIQNYRQFLLSLVFLLHAQCNWEIENEASRQNGHFSRFKKKKEEEEEAFPGFHGACNYGNRFGGLFFHRKRRFL